MNYGKKIYISGQVTELPESRAREIFKNAELYLKIKCYEPVNPMELNHAGSTSWSDYMRMDIAALCQCASIYMLNGWDRSRGARLEFQIATELGLNVIFQ